MSKVLDTTGLTKTINKLKSYANSKIDSILRFETLKLTVSNFNSTSVAGLQCSINGNTYILDSTGIITTYIPYGTTYSVTLYNYGDYLAPSAVTYTASLSTRSVSLVNTTALGIFILDTTGKLWTTDAWNSTATPNAIAVLTSEAKFLIALKQISSSMAISSNSSDPLENYMIAISNSTAAKADYNGATNTANIMKMQSSTSYAAGACNAYTFPDGKTKGYLPALGEWVIAKNNKNAINSAISKCGGTAIVEQFHWSSTYGYYDDEGRRCWLLSWLFGYGEGVWPINLKYVVRAFGAYS